LPGNWQLRTEDDFLERRVKYRLNLLSIGFLCLLILWALSAGGCGGSERPRLRGNVVTATAGQDDLSTWNLLLERADMAERLAVTVGPVTVFAPTNDAFDLLPAGTVEHLLRPEDRARLVDVIENHLARDDLTTARFPTVGAVRTLTGDRVPIRYAAESWWYGEARVVRPDWRHTKNGVVHVINRVAWPSQERTRELP